MHVVFVCTGNICRSAFAERYGRLRAQQMGSSIRFSSVGVGAVIGAGMDELMAAELVQRGGDPSGFVARQLDYDAIADADILLPMEQQHRNVLIEEYPRLHRSSFVLRTAARSASAYPANGRRLEQVLAERPHPVRGDGVRDPFRRGPRAAAEAAAQIAEAIDTLVADASAPNAAR